MQDRVYKQVETIAKGIKYDLRQKGLVIPTENKDGTITVDTYTIVKQRSGFYNIEDKDGDIVVDKINLPQTAAVIANNLALNKGVDDRLLKHDREYGYSYFEEEQAKRIISNHKDWDKVDVMYTKMDMARHRKLSAKSAIIHSFEKLRSLR
jgi:hypothetical protein